VTSGRAEGIGFQRWKGGSGGCPLVAIGVRLELESRVALYRRAVLTTVGEQTRPQVTIANMGGELAGWAAFAASLLSIGLEVWRSKRHPSAGKDSAASSEPRPSAQADRFFLTRGVSALSIVGVAVVIFAIYGLQAWSEALQLDARYVRDCLGQVCFGTTADQLTAAKLDLTVSVVNLAVVLSYCGLGLLILRVLLYVVICLVVWCRSSRPVGYPGGGARIYTNRPPNTTERETAQERLGRRSGRQRKTKRFFKHR
jgi:hypothetical protein